MLDRKLIRKDPETVKEGIKKKGVEFDIDGFLELDGRMRSLIHEVEKLKHERNVSSDKISECKKEKKNYYDSVATHADVREFLEQRPRRPEPEALKIGGWIAIAVGLLMLAMGGSFWLWG